MNIINEQNDFENAFGFNIGKRNFNFPIDQIIVVPPIDAVTWDPENKGASIELSGGNLIVDASDVGNDYNQVIATLGRSSGKYYFEAEHITGTYNMVGVQNGSESVELYLGDTSDGWGYRTNTRIYNSSYTTGIGASWIDGDIIGCAVNLDTGEIWWSINGVWVASGDPGAGTGSQYSNLSGEMWPAVSVYYTTAQIKGRFKLSDFDYTPPSGFSAWEN